MRSILTFVICATLAFITSFAVITSAQTVHEPTDIVKTDDAVYTPVMMMANLDSLCKIYPEWIEYTCSDTTFQGNPLPIVTFGCREFDCPSIMIQAAMHSREYMSAQLVMALLERYAFHCASGKALNGYDVRDLFSRVHLTIMPMVNPDGVDIAQRGAAAARDSATVRWLEQQCNNGERYDRLKANSRGVDLNRNFPNGHNQASNRATSPAFSHYPGEKPISETESFVMMRVAWTRDYLLFLNYHCCGNLLYYGCKNAPSKVNTSARKFADIITATTGYRSIGPDKMPANGSWADQVETLFEAPSVTIETGTRTPVPAREFPSIFNRNLAVWARLASFIDSNEQ